MPGVLIFYVLSENSIFHQVLYPFPFGWWKPVETKKGSAADIYDCTHPCLFISFGIDKNEMGRRQIKRPNNRVFAVVAINHPHIFHLINKRRNRD